LPAERDPVDLAGAERRRLHRDTDEETVADGGEHLVACGTGVHGEGAVEAAVSFCEAGCVADHGFPAVGEVEPDPKRRGPRFLHLLPERAGKEPLQVGARAVIDRRHLPVRGDAHVDRAGLGRVGSEAEHAASYFSFSL